MNEKDLKKLNRRQLLELLLKQTERADKLKIQLEDAQKKLNDKKLVEKEAGSIAQAALELNGIFTAADLAVAQYIENVKALSENQEEINKQREAESQKKAALIITNAEETCKQRLEETEKKCKQRELESENKIKEITEKLQNLYQQKQSLDDFFKNLTV